MDGQEGELTSAGELALEALREAEACLGSASDGPAPRRPTRLARLLACDPLLLGEVHEALSNIATSQGQSAESLSHLALALGIHEQDQDPRAIAHVAGNLGLTYLLRGDAQLAQQHLARSFALAEQVGDRAVMAVAALNLGELSTRGGALPAAETWFRRSLTLTRQAGDRETMIWCYDALATAYRDER